MQPHSWIEPHPFQKLIQPQSKTDVESIQPQLEYNPTHVNYDIFKVIKSQSKADFETIQPQLEYNPTSLLRAKMVLSKISNFLSINTSCCSNQLGIFFNAVRKGHTIKSMNFKSIKKVNEVNEQQERSWIQILSFTTYLIEPHLKYNPRWVRFE